MDCACERWHERELRAHDLLLPEGHGDCLAPDTHWLAAFAIAADCLDREQCGRAIGQVGPDLSEDSDCAVAEVGMLRDLQEHGCRVQVVTCATQPISVMVYYATRGTLLIVTMTSMPMCNGKLRT